MKPSQTSFFRRFPLFQDLVGQPPKPIDNFQDEAWYAHEVMAPGAYRQVCVEIKLQNLAVCAIDNAPLLAELEGIETEDGELRCVALWLSPPPSPCHPSFPHYFSRVFRSQSVSRISTGGEAFKVLRQLVTRWINDASMHGSRYADQLLENLQRWLSTSTSMVYDVHLQHALHSLMQKCFLQLVAEVRQRLHLALLLLLLFRPFPVLSVFLIPIGF